MIQKLKQLHLQAIKLNKKLGREGYPYDSKKMSKIELNTSWNATYTIKNRDEFNTQVITASYKKPVLVKFGLTYCVHCLLLENLGSLPAVSKKYKPFIDVYKFWWNPQDPKMKELNQLATQQGVRSSPHFILYVNGKPVQEGYAFPDEKGEGMEEFLEGFIPPTEPLE